MNFKRQIIWILGLLLAACAGALQSDLGGDFTPSAPPPARATEITLEAPTAAPTLAASPGPLESVQAEPSATLLPEETAPRGATREFTTDFRVHAVPYTEILSGGPPKDGIPAIDNPRYVSVTEADRWLEPVEPVILVQVGEHTRAYPLQILTWHEIVNDTLGGLPLTVTFCPLCNTGIAFERTVDGRVLDFGTTGRLRFSNLIMYDRQTETWWQQADGRAIVGALTGARLNFYPAQIIAWQAFKDRSPEGSVLSRVTGFNRPYGQNPYPGYDDVNRPPFLYKGPTTPGELLPMERVLTVDMGAEAAAYPYKVLSEIFVVNDTLGGVEMVVFWSSGTASALDALTVSGGRDVGSAAAFRRRLGDRVLEFRSADGQRRAGERRAGERRAGEFVDRQTGSAWNSLGQAVSGPLKGTQLEPLVSIDHFWFSWAAFRPDTRIFTPFE